MSVKKFFYISMIMFIIIVKNVFLFILMIFICSCCIYSFGLGVLVWNVIYIRYMYIVKGKCIWEGYIIFGRFYNYFYWRFLFGVWVIKYVKMRKIKVNWKKK